MQHAIPKDRISRSKEHKANILKQLLIWSTKNNYHQETVTNITSIHEAIY